MPAVHRYFLPLLISLAVAASLWPSLGWVELSNASEQLVVGAALESLRDGSPETLWHPMLGGEPRLRKPPLATWAAMAATSTAEARRLAEGPIDEAAFRWVTIKIRTVSLVVAAGILLLTFELGRLLAGRRAGLVAMAVLASTYGFLEQAPRATTDLHLCLWVLAANVAMAHAVLRRRWAVGLTLAGAALGLAIMSKGPVGLVQTIPAVLVFLIVRRLSLRARLKHRGRRWQRTSLTRAPLPRILAGLAAGTLLMLVIGLAWFVDAWFRNPAAAAQWTTEVSRHDATSVGPDHPWDYLIFFVLMVPWTVFFSIALVAALNETVRRMLPRWRGIPGVERYRGPGVLMALALTIVPILIMVWFPDRKERYLLPMIPPAAVLTAIGVLAVWRDAVKRPRGVRAAWLAHLALVAVLALGVPILTMLVPRSKTDGDLAPWLPPSIGLPLLAVAATIVVAMFVAWRRWGVGGAVAGTTVAMLFTANALFLGYGNSYEGRSELKPLVKIVRVAYDDFDPVYTDPRSPPPDVHIYLGRVTRYSADPAAIPPGPRPIVWISSHRGDEPPLEVPPGWRLLGSTRRSSTMWYALAREPA